MSSVMLFGVKLKLLTIVPTNPVFEAIERPVMTSSQPNSRNRPATNAAVRCTS